MTLGLGRLSKDLRQLQHATASIYSAREGYYIWGKRLEEGVATTEAKRSFSEAADERFSPCPPVYADYTLLNGAPGGNPCAPVECQLETLYSTDYFGGGGFLWVVFKCQLIVGRTYRLACETDFTQPAFDSFHAGLTYWQPSDWPGETVAPRGGTYEDEDNEDTEPYWCPYPYKLNYELAPGAWAGGRRYEFTATETGFHVFMFWIDFAP